ncbi:MAG TPA: YceI family protein [Gaiellaceae bacterium]|jgi:polyisoprenoid-binding protein YceI
MITTVRPFVGTYDLDPVHSSFHFAVTHIVSTFRASFGDVDGRLVAEEGTITLTASARVESLSIVDPPEFREHVVRGADFFQADDYPELTFRSTEIELRDDGSTTVTGDLTIRGVTRRVSAEGTYRAPIEDPFGGERAGLELRTTVDRRAWDLSWQTPLPDGGDALGWEVELTGHLELVKAVP